MAQQYTSSDFTIKDFHGNAQRYSDALSSKVQYLKDAQTKGFVAKKDDKAVKDFIDFHGFINEKLKRFSKLQGNLGTKLNIPKATEKKLKQDISLITTKIEREVKCQVIDSISVSQKSNPKPIAKEVHSIRKGLFKFNETSSTYAMKIFMGIDLSSDEIINGSKSENDTENQKNEEENEEYVTNGAYQIDWSLGLLTEGIIRLENNGKHPTTSIKETHMHQRNAVDVLVESNQTEFKDFQWYKDQVDKLEKKLDLVVLEDIHCEKLLSAKTSKIAKLENQIGNLTHELEKEKDTYKQHEKQYERELQQLKDENVRHEKAYLELKKQNQDILTKPETSHQWQRAIQLNCTSVVQYLPDDIVNLMYEREIITSKERTHLRKIKENKGIHACNDEIVSLLARKTDTNLTAFISILENHECSSVKELASKIKSSR